MTNIKPKVLCYFTSWMPRPVRCSWRSGRPCGTGAGFPPRSRSLGPTRFALRFRYCPKSPSRGRWACWPWWDLQLILRGTLLIGCAIIVLDGFDDVRFNVFGFLQHDLWPSCQLPILVVSESTRLCSLGCGLLHLVREPESGKQHG